MFTGLGPDCLLFPPVAFLAPLASRSRVWGAAVLGCAPPHQSEGIRAAAGTGPGVCEPGKGAAGDLQPHGHPEVSGVAGKPRPASPPAASLEEREGQPSGLGRRGEVALLSQHPAVPRAAPVLSSCLWSSPPFPCGAAEGQGTRADEELPPGALFGEQLCPQLCGCSEEPLGLLGPAVPGALGGDEGEGAALVLEFCRRTSSLPARKAVCL